jgi:hypothetical protein
VDDTLAVLVMLPQPAHLAIELAGVPANLPEQKHMKNCIVGQ